jgi:O-methyltransferase involved in polyketide biosynthesis
VNLLRRGSDAISPTAHYTGEVWRRNDLSHPGLGSARGRTMHLLNLPFSGHLDGMLLARHHAIDNVLEAAIERGEIGQVIEVACGMSPRGWRFAGRGDVDYVEADLPAMAGRKRRALEEIGASHRVVELDALAPGELDALTATLDHDRGLAIVTEGLLPYLPTDAVLGMWARFAAALGEFPHGLYVSDLHVASDMSGVRARVFGVILATFVRGRIHVHFEDAAGATAALEEAGFAEASVLPAAEHHPASGDAGHRVQLLVASAH